MTDGRCLSCPIRPQEAENLSLSDGKGNIEDSPPLSIIAAETLYLDDLHSIPPHVHGVSHLHADYSRLTRLHNPLHSSFFQFLFFTTPAFGRLYTRTTDPIQSSSLGKPIHHAQAEV